MTPHAKASEISSIIKQVVPYLQMMAKKSFFLVNQDDEQQDILNALPDFGISAVDALAIYSAIYSALNSIGKSNGITSPDLSVFQPQQDGTVLYVAPLMQEVEPEQTP